MVKLFFAFSIGLCLFFRICGVNISSATDTRPYQPDIVGSSSPEIGPSSVIDPNNIDTDLLKSLVHEKVNAVRRSKGCAVLDTDALLDEAAAEQAGYVTQRGSLSHEQPSPEKANVMKRVKLVGGKFVPVGENLLYQGFVHRTENGHERILYPTYEEMAKDMVKGWTKSKPHYANMIDREFKYAGTAVSYSYKKGGFFAAQVFGGTKK